METRPGMGDPPAPARMLMAAAALAAAAGGDGRDDDFGSEHGFGANMILGDAGSSPTSTVSRGLGLRGDAARSCGRAESAAGGTHPRNARQPPAHVAAAANAASNFGGGGIGSGSLCRSEGCQPASYD